jgi:uncharacterized membrane protein YhhN
LVAGSTPAGRAENPDFIRVFHQGYMKRTFIAPLTFFFITICYIVLEFNDPASLPALFTKAIPLLVLFIWFYNASSDSEKVTRRLLLAGLLFALTGDLLLQYNNRNPSFFIYGLCSFLFTQIMYSLAFFQGGSLGSRLLKNFAAILVFLVYGFLLVSWLKAGLGEMLIPVSIYAFVICIMSIAAFSRSGIVSRISFLITLSGAILFLASDSMIAIARFGHAFPMSRIIILVTYYLGQYLIVHGMLQNEARN